jgi:hypothetical protein
MWILGGVDRFLWELWFCGFELPSPSWISIPTNFNLIQSYTKQKICFHLNFFISNGCFCFIINIPFLFHKTSLRMPILLIKDANLRGFFLELLCLWLGLLRTLMLLLISFSENYIYFKWVVPRFVWWL